MDERTPPNLLNASAARPDAPKPAARRRRLALMVSIPAVLLLIGGYLWITSGRYATTENAYVKQDKVSIGPDVAGRIVAVLVAENQHVSAGTPLFKLDPEPFQIALANADAALASARISVEQLHAAYEESLADLSTAQSDVDFQTREYERQSALAKKGVAAEAKLDDARHALQAAQDDVAKNSQTVLSAKAALGQDPNQAIDDHPLVKQAMARRAQAALDLSHAVVYAPDAGIVSRTALLQVGMYVVTGTPVFSLVKDSPVWVEANFKETDLTHMAAGQKAKIRLDVYSSKPFEATVESIGAGTGSEFSLLPAQNASGNWVKVVQRVPVRLKIVSVPDGLVLRTGLSAKVTVDTKSVSAGAPRDSRDTPTAMTLEHHS